MNNSFKRIGIFESTNYVNVEPEGNCYYMIRGNICIVNLIIRCVSPLFSNHLVFSYAVLPRIINNVYAFGALVPINANNTSAMIAGTNRTGGLYVRGGVADIIYSGQFSYIIE